MSEVKSDIELLAEPIIGAFNERDLPALLGFFHRDALLKEDQDFSPNPATYRGWVEIATYWESFDRAWADLRVELEETRSVGSTLVVFSRFTARGKTSGVPIETPVAMVGVFDDGKLTRLDFHMDRQKALEAAGLSE